MRIQKIIRFSDHFPVESAFLTDQGAIDPILNFDSRFFIDPMLIQQSSATELSGEGSRLLDEFLGKVFQLLKAAKRIGDPAWRGAARLLSGREFPGIGLGYGGSRTTGSSLDSGLSTTMLESAKEMIDIGVDSPELFLMMPLLIEGIGPDTISDITAGAIKTALATYTERVVSNDTAISVEEFDLAGSRFKLPVHPFQPGKSPIFLLPSDIVADLPIASCWSEIATVCSFNQQVRDKFDRIAGQVFSGRATKNSEAKRNARIAVKEVEGFATELVDVLKALKKDGALARNEPGFVALSRMADDPRLAESQFGVPVVPTSSDEARKIVLSIVSDFKFLIEDRRMSALLYGLDDRPHREDIAQKLFFMVAYAHCKAWNLDVTPEAETGNGPVDFKFSYGFNCRVPVEIKLSTNPRAVKGFETQLTRYMKGEETDKGVFVLIDVGSIGNKMKQIEVLAKKYEADPIYVDGKQRGSASKE